MDSHKLKVREEATWCVFWGKFPMIRSDSGSGGQISWDRNSFFHEVEIKFVHEIEIHNNIFTILIRRSVLLGNFDLMKTAAIRRSNQLLGILTSWSIIQSPEKVEFRSHEIRPHDQCPKILNWINPDILIAARKVNYPIGL